MSWCNVVKKDTDVKPNNPSNNQLEKTQNSNVQVNDIDIHEDSYEVLFDNKYNTDIEDLFLDMKNFLKDNSINILDIKSDNAFCDFYYLLLNNTNAHFTQNVLENDEDDVIETNEYY